MLEGEVVVSCDGIEGGKLNVRVEACVVFENVNLLNSKNSSERRVTSGFGLSISQELLRALEGSALHIARAGSGSLISFDIPISQPGLANIKCDPPFNALSGLKVLVIDDCPFNTMTIRMLLQSLNIHCIEAHSALEGIRHLQSDEDIALVLLDLEMPEVSGFECMQRLQALQIGKELSALPPIVAHSASAMEEDRRLCEALGFVCFLEKPVSKAQLLRTIQVYTSTD